MSHTRLMFTLVLLAVLTAFSSIFAPMSMADDAGKCPIVPRPREFQLIGESWTLGNEKNAAILKNDACPYAQERLQALIRNRFKREIPILAADALPESVTQVFSMTLSGENLPWNGFKIEFRTLEDSHAKQEIAITGADLSGVIYGVEALFNLIRKPVSDAEDQPEILCATVRDWPSIPWRGRPHSVVAHHLQPGQLDAYMHARLNFSDFRDDPDQVATMIMPARKSSMGCVPGKPIDEELFNRVFTEFKRRGMFVYGTVSCKLEAGQYSKLTDTFDALLTLGCDGIWVSMDDTGGGKEPVKLAQFVADYMKKRSITGHQMVFTPAMQEYMNIDRALNREMAKIDGFNSGYWIFTRVPCAADLALCQKIGLKQKPCWWFNYCETNYPDPKAGFIHSSTALTSQRKNGKPSYMNLLPMTPGWGGPEFDRIRDAAKYTDQVNLWGLCGGWPTEYALVMFGLWAWNPETCDWETLRDSIYDFVWGPGQVATIREFDVLYAELKTFYHLPVNVSFRAPENTLVRLKNTADRPRVLEILNRLDALAAELAERSPSETALTASRLEEMYLEPMRASLFFARKQATLEYPEYRFKDFEKNLTAEMAKITQEKGSDAAREHALATCAELEGIIATLSREFAELKDIEPVLDLWRKRIQTQKEQLK